MFNEKIANYLVEIEEDLKQIESKKVDKKFDKILEQNNINKLIATRKAGYEVKLIREGKELDYAIVAG